MRADDFAVAVSGGTGIVHRGPGAVVLLPAPTAAQAAAARSVLAACSGPADPTGRRAVRAVAAVLATAEPAETPAFAAAFPTDRGLVVLVHGDAQADVDTGTTVRLRGTDSLAWVERSFTEGVREVSLSGLAAAAPPADDGFGMLDLVRGTVPGGGAWLRPSSVPAPVPAPAPAPAPVAAAAPVTPSISMATLPAAPPAPLAPAAPAAPAAPPAPAAPRQDDLPQVHGALCSRGHFNDPSAAYCNVCGISMQQRTTELLLGTRPPLGVLVLDDGQAVSLDGDVLLGREPERHPAVLAGEATPFRINDDVDGVSRVHARIVLRDWSVCLTDEDSANGTYLVEGQESQPVRGTHPVPLHNGAVLRIGRRTVTFYSYHSGGE